MHVLLLDPQAVSQKLLRHIIEQVADMTVVETWEQARLNLRAADFDAVVVSVDQGVEELLDFVRDLRALDEPISRRPLILISALADGYVRYSAWRAGVHVTLAKPFRPEQLVRALVDQVADPQVQAVERSYCDVQVVSWRRGPEHLRYVPDLDRRFVALSAEEVDRAVRGSLREHAQPLCHSACGEARVQLATMRVSQEGDPASRPRPVDQSGADGLMV